MNKKADKTLFIKILSTTYKNWRDDRTLRLGAGIAYYGVFAIVPVVTLMIGVAAIFYSTQDIQIFITDALSRVVSSDAMSELNVVIERLIINDIQDKLFGASIISLVSLVIAASFIFVAIQDAFDVIWHKSVRLGLKKWVKKYAWAYVVVLISSLVLLSAIIVRSTASYMTSLFPDQFLFELMSNIAVTVATWTVGVMLLSFIYNILVYEKISWRIIVFSAFVTAVLIYFGTWLLSIYLSNFGASSAGGVVGSFLLLLLWIYYEAQILLIGAQLMKSLQQHRGTLPNLLRA